DESRELQQRVGLEADLLDHGVEGAGIAAVAPEHSFDVEGCGVEPRRNGRDLSRQDKQEDSVRVNEAADQPRTGDAVHFRAAARDPDRAVLVITRRQLVGADKWLVGLLPALEPAFERLRIDAVVAQPRSRALAELLSA